MVRYSKPVTLADYRKRGPQFGLIAVEFPNLERMLARASQGTSLSVTRRIVQEELRALGKGVLTPAFRQFAPEKLGGGIGPLHASYASEFTGKGHAPRFWQDRQRHLRPSINYELAGGQTLRLRMRKHGRFTAFEEGNGSGEIRPRKGAVLKIELPGGDVIYRPRVRTISPERKGWAKHAYNWVLHHRYFETTGKRIALRTMVEMFAPLYLQDVSTLGTEMVMGQRYMGLNTARGAKVLEAAGLDPDITLPPRPRFGVKRGRPVRVEASTARRQMYRKRAKRYSEGIKKAKTKGEARRYRTLLRQNIRRFGRSGR